MAKGKSQNPNFKDWLARVGRHSHLCHLLFAICLFNLLLSCRPIRAQVWTDAFLNSINRTWQAPCGTFGAATSQIANSLASLTQYQGGTLDLDCYQEAVSITADVFSPISVPVTVFLPAHTVTVNANATIPHNFMICSISGGSIVAGVGYTLTNNAQSCFNGGSGGTPGGPEYAVQFNYPDGTFGGVSNVLLNSPDTVAPEALDLNNGMGFEFDSAGVGSANSSNGVLIGTSEQAGDLAPWITTFDNGAFSAGSPSAFIANLSDASAPPGDSFPISSVSLTNDLVTITTSTATNLSVGYVFELSGLTNATFLNGANIYVLNVQVSSAPYTVTGYFSHANYGPTADTGTVTPELGTEETSYFTSISETFNGDFATGYLYIPYDPECNPAAGTCESEIAFEAGAQGDGPNYAYQFDASPAPYVNFESADFEDESAYALIAPYVYVFKVGSFGSEPAWWLYQDGSQYTRSPYIQQIETTVGACSMTPGLSDCTATLQSELLGNGGPPTTETINFVVCNTSSNYDTIAFEQFGGTPECNGSSPVLATVAATPQYIGNSLYITFAASTGHTLGATGSFTVTVNNGTMLSPFGGSFFDSNPVEDPTAPGAVATCTTACTTNRTYAAVAFFNGAPTDLGSTVTVANNATLSGANFNTITMPDIPTGYGITCAIMRTNDGGGSPSTTGYLKDGSGNIIILDCDSSSTITDNGLAADGSKPPAYNTTGGVVATLFAAPIETSMQFFTEGEGITNDGSFIFWDQNAASGEVTGSKFDVSVGAAVNLRGSTLDVELSTDALGGFIFNDAMNGEFFTNDRLKFGVFTVSTLPASPAAFDMAWVSDGSTALTCTLGSGTYKNLCVYDGTAWTFVLNVP